jgi:hypothetical protein
MQILRMFSDLKDFDYEAPQMQYDKKSGDIKIIEGKQATNTGPKKKVIGNVDDLEREKKALFEELGLDEKGYPKNTKEPVDKIADRLKAAQDRMSREFEMDPSAFHVFSRDLMRVDVGLLIQRPPIFMQMRDRDVQFLKFKNDIMNEYYCNQK